MLSWFGRPGIDKVSQIVDGAPVTVPRPERLLGESSVVVIQRWYRAAVRRHCRRLRPCDGPEESAAVRIQAAWRASEELMAYNFYRVMVRAAVSLQRFFRGWVCRERFLHVLAAKLAIESLARCELARRRHDCPRPHRIGVRNSVDLRRSSPERCRGWDGVGRTCGDADDDEDASPVPVKHRAWSLVQSNAKSERAPVVSWF